MCIYFVKFIQHVGLNDTRIVFYMGQYLLHFTETFNNVLQILFHLVPQPLSYYF